MGERPQKRWPDICYHFMIGPDGSIWETRAGSLAAPVVADATGGNHGYAQLVCLIGDFSSQAPTPAAPESLTRMLMHLADRYDVDDLRPPGRHLHRLSRRQRPRAPG